MGYLTEIDNKEVRERQVGRILRAFEGSLRPYSHLLTVCAEATDAELKEVEWMMSDWADQRLVLRSGKHSDEEELKLIQKGLDKLFRITDRVITERLLAIKKNKGRAINFEQPVYKIQTIADILGVTKPTVNNWTHKRGSYLRAFELPGIAKFVLEEDLCRKYEEVLGRTLIVDDEFREKYQYLPNQKKLREALQGQL